MGVVGLGKCPFCNGHIEKRKTNSSKKVFIYACSNAHWVFDNDFWRPTDDSKCSFKIFSNSLAKWNKFFISPLEIKALLNKGSVEISLFKRCYIFENGRKVKKDIEYKKDIIPNLEYGVEVLWD